MVLPFQPLSMAFNHISYYVDMPDVSYSILSAFFYAFVLCNITKHVYFHFELIRSLAFVSVYINEVFLSFTWIM